ncbi:MAG TPA: 30S ribosomal protein S4 [archaeon]|nr:30S ribosomal protein S4 [archaeon]
MKQQKPTYSKPAKKYDKARITEEAKLVRLYGLKNKRELWKAKHVISGFRNAARKFFTDQTGKDELFAKLAREGIMKGEFTVDDVLSLKVNDLLERRLQTLVYRQGLAHSMEQARQVITHGHVTVNGRRVSVPGYRVNVAEEKTITYSPGSVLSDPEHPLRKGPKVEEEAKTETVSEVKADKKSEESEKVKEERGATVKVAENPKAENINPEVEEKNQPADVNAEEKSESVVEEESE